VIRRILAPTDGSPTAEAAIQFAKDIALAENAEVVVLGVIRTEGYGDIPGYDPLSGHEPAIQRIVGDEVEDLAEAGVIARGEVVVGSEIASTIIDQVQRQGADLVVMGTHGHTGLARAIIGSVADRVVRHSDVPVLLVPLKS